MQYFNQAHLMVSSEASMHCACGDVHTKAAYIYTPHLYHRSLKGTAIELY